MNAIERRAVTSLAGVFGLRMFGLFMILPIFALYARELDGVTPMLIGLTLGAYGLTQAILQIPFGVLSDRWGRKQAILLGLAIFAVGSVIAAMSDSIYGVLLGRLVQGAGAVSAAISALLADLTREDQRTKAMAIIGVGIGVVFMLSMILAPLLEGWVGMKGIFWLTAVLAVLAMSVVQWVTPRPMNSARHREAEPVVSQIGDVLRDHQLLRLDWGIFTLHWVLTAMWVVVPVLLLEQGGLPNAGHWKVYLPVMIAGVIGMLPLVGMAHDRKKVGQSFKLAIAILALGELLLWWAAGQNWWGVLAGLVVFFIGFNTLEASLPSLISRVAPPASKGTAMGVYNSAQFFGVFVGGTSAGWLYGMWGAQGVFLACLILVVVWLLMSLHAPVFKLGDNRLLPIGTRSEAEITELNQKIRAVRGVEDVTLWAGEPTAYLRVNREILDEAALSKLMHREQAVSG